MRRRIRGRAVILRCARVMAKEELDSENQRSSMVMDELQL